MRKVETKEDRVELIIEPSPPTGYTIIVKEVRTFGLLSQQITLTPSQRSIIYFKNLRPGIKYNAFLRSDGSDDYILGDFTTPTKRTGKKYFVCIVINNHIIACSHRHKCHYSEPQNPCFMCDLATVERTKTLYVAPEMLCSSGQKCWSHY